MIHQLVFRSNLHDIFSAPNEYTMLRLSIFCEILYTWIWGSNLQLYGKLRGKSSVHCTHTRMQHSSLSPNNIEHVNKSTNYVAFLNKPFALCNSFLLPVDRSKNILLFPTLTNINKKHAKQLYFGNFDSYILFSLPVCALQSHIFVQQIDFHKLSIISNHKHTNDQQNQLNRLTLFFIILKFNQTFP